MQARRRRYIVSTESDARNRRFARLARIRKTATARGGGRATRLQAEGSLSIPNLITLGRILLVPIVVWAILAVYLLCMGWLVGRGHIPRVFAALALLAVAVLVLI